MLHVKNNKPKFKSTGIKKTDLSDIIYRCSHDNQHRGPDWILWKLAILITGTQTMAKVTTQLRDTNEKNEREKPTKM